MKRIIAIALSVLMISAADMWAQGRPKKPVYVIDHVVVENFDGSQIANKTIADYKIDAVSGIHVVLTSAYAKQMKIASSSVKDEAGGFAVVSVDAKGNAVATTKVAGMARGKRDGVRPEGQRRKDKQMVVSFGDSVCANDGSLVDDNGMLYVLNRRVVPAARAKAAENIKSMQVIKDKENADFRKYAEALSVLTGEEVAAVVLIATERSKDVVYVVDDNPVSDAEFKAISPKNIVSMRVIKSKEDADFKKYAKEGTATVMIIVTR